MLGLAKTIRVSFRLEWFSHRPVVRRHLPASAQVGQGALRLQAEFGPPSHLAFMARSTHAGIHGNVTVAEACKKHGQAWAAIPRARCGALASSSVAGMQDDPLGGPDAGNTIVESV